MGDGWLSERQRHGGVDAVPLPRDVPGTDLASRPPRYWQLEVNGEVRGADYAGRFLVPVYG